MWRQPGDPARVQPAVAEHLEQDRVLAGDDLGLDPPRLLHELEQLT
jgi:hypothetical protein